MVICTLVFSVGVLRVKQAHAWAILQRAYHYSGPSSVRAVHDPDAIRHAATPET